MAVADGQRTIRDSDDEQRQRIAYQATLTLTARDTAQVAQAWWQGLNPQLDDVSPARVLREENPAAGGPPVLAAARAFAGVG